MLHFLSKFFRERKIDCFAPIPLGLCRITRPYLLERSGITDGTAVMLAVPYYSPACDAPDRNLSAYAVPRNYHAFFENLFAELLPLLRVRFPENRFAGFADHSPIAETEAAARTGLGVIGDNGLLLTEKYSSYVFLGELITDSVLPSTPVEIRFCEHCGACHKACPSDDCGGCLSALTQKKGELTEEESEKLLRYGTVWGCDICQEVCPHTLSAIRNRTVYTEIPYFLEQTVSRLTLDGLDAMSEDIFAERAFSWRGRKTIRRNLLIADNKANMEDN